jgi:hypothetical protein
MHSLTPFFGCSAAILWVIISERVLYVVNEASFSLVRELIEFKYLQMLHLYHTKIYGFQVLQ